MELNKYEKARLIGARALQLATGAPPLIEIAGEMALNPVSISFLEFERGVIPIVVVKD
ncbi:MAG: DNA-directed RNA polymerase subunit K [Candidatus Micrarchaeota archaeon]|nr:DNA-directed RNA polymerase subunit K [Candidatus Micrarchaeota archaeon]